MGFRLVAMSPDCLIWCPPLPLGGCWPPSSSIMLLCLIEIAATYMQTKYSTAQQRGNRARDWRKSFHSVKGNRFFKVHGLWEDYCGGWFKVKMSFVGEKQNCIQRFYWGFFYLRRRDCFQFGLLVCQQDYRITTSLIFMKLSAWV